MRIYAIGDIHGQSDMLRAAHSRIAADREVCGDQTAKVVHLGDFTDRGPDSRGVIDLLIAGLEAGAPWIVIKGNHDRMFAGFMADHDHQDPVMRKDLIWLDPRLGGVETLASYGVTARLWTSNRNLWKAAIAAVPKPHLDFLDRLVLSHQTDDLFFCHAGIRPGVPLDQQTEDDLVWIRSPFLEDDRDHGKLIVHGHTALEAPEHFGNRVDLDSGAGYGRPLTAAVFEGRECFILTDRGREPLVPPLGY